MFLKSIVSIVINPL